MIDQWVGRLPRRLRDQPIIKQERLHLLRSKQIRNRRGIEWLFILLLVSGIGFQIADRFQPQIAQFLNQPLRGVESFIDWAKDFLPSIAILLLIVQHLGVGWTALRLASGTLARERQNRTWETLVLTAVSARRIVFGKWLAVITLQWQFQRRALLLRAALIAWVLFEAHFQQPPPLETWGIAALGVVLVALAPMVNVLFGAAVGVLASAFTRSEVGAARVAGLLEFMVLLPLLISGGLVGNLFVRLGGLSNEISILQSTLLLAFIDGGIFALANVVSARYLELSAYYFMGLLLWAGVFTLIALGIVSIAQSWVVRLGALRGVKTRL